MTSISTGLSQDVNSYLSISCLDTEMGRRTVRLYMRVLFCSYDTPFLFYFIEICWSWIYVYI